MNSQPNRPNLDDYVPVNDRVAAFLEKYPDGSLQSEIVVHTETLIVMTASAYRTPDDPRPGKGTSQIEVPGRTPFTRGSEIENCETSAWGRALAALGFEVKRGIASAEEVQNKSGEAQKPATAPRTAPAPPRPVAAQNDAPALSDDDWAGLVGEKPDQTNAPPTNGAGHMGGLSSRELFTRLESANVDKKVATAAARKLFGDDNWQITKLTDEQRAAIGEEVGVA